MNTPRAVLQSLPSLPPSITQKFQGALVAILMTSFSLAQAEEQKNTSNIQIKETIQWEDLSQVFEGFTRMLKYDPEHKTWNIGYGTDIGEKNTAWPYGSFADDVVDCMEKENLTKDEIRNILQGRQWISEELGKKLFSMRYDKRKEIVSHKYEILYNKKFTSLPEIVQYAVVDFSYNMRGEWGIFPSPGFPGFPEACKALRDEDWPKLAHEITDSKYADQVGPRAWYWVTQLVKLSGKPLKTMTSDVKQEVKSFQKVKEDVDMRIAQVLSRKQKNNG